MLILGRAFYVYYFATAIRRESQDQRTWKQVETVTRWVSGMKAPTVLHWKSEGRSYPLLMYLQSGVSLQTMLEAI